MKKIFITIFVLCTALSMQATIHLTYQQWVGDDLVNTNITKDTTIIVTEYEYDEDLEEATMHIKGTLYSDVSENITATITRQATGIIDQFCAGENCIPGNKDLTQEIGLKIGSLPSDRQWIAHFTPTEPGVTTIKYGFNDYSNTFGSQIHLTVKYCYMTSAVEDIFSPQHNGKIYNLLGQEMPGTELNELPAGIYIINGKKYIKQ